MKKIILSGYGNVGREFVRLLDEKREYINKKYNIDLVLCGVLGSKTFIYDENGLDIEALLNCKGGSQGLFEYRDIKNQNYDNRDIISGDVLVESTPTNINTGKPGLDIILWGINKNMNIVSISKGALVTNFTKIINLIKMKNLNLKYSGATAAALPTIDTGEYSLSGCEIIKIEGVLNGTTNYILSRMYRDNLTFKEALNQAKNKGIAETNSTLDIKGIDSACKILLISNNLFNFNFSLKDISIGGIEEITRDDILKASDMGAKIKLIARAYWSKDKFKMEVKPDYIYENHLLYGVNDTNKGIVFFTDNMGEVASIGGASSPRGAASAALKDLINIYSRK